jgi:hypothetical protein
VRCLRCYALSIENAGGNNDTKCLYFPFYMDQAPLTWLESLEKYSIGKWDQLKEQLTSNFAVTRAATATTTGTKAVAVTTTQVPIASASQTTLSRLSSAL